MQNGNIAYGKNGAKITGSMASRGSLNWSGSNTTYGVPAGYYSGGTLDSRPSYNDGYNAGVSDKASPTTAGYLTIPASTGDNYTLMHDLGFPANQFVAVAESFPAAIIYIESIGCNICIIDGTVYSGRISMSGHVISVRGNFYSANGKRFIYHAAQIK